ncbi:MAG TPA: penicillin-binding protein 2 [Clostridiaceae bacterium]|nr:penicillin-binding protein 2 [Clostridiaceae bacterium]
MKKFFKDRFVIVALFFLAFGIAIVFQLVKIQIIHGEEYDKASQRKVLKERTILASRGNIMDRNGIPVAVNRQGFTIQIVKAGLNTAELNDMVLRLVDIFEKNNDNYNKTLRKYLTFNPVTFNSHSLETIKNWQERVFGIKGEDFISSPEEFFNYLREKVFIIDPKYSDDEAYKIMTIRYEILVNNWFYTIGNPVSLAKDVSINTIAEVEERHHEFKGIITGTEPLRKYLNAADAAHVIGYVGSINAEQLEKYKADGYGPNDIIGQTGIEAYAEKYLRGKDGIKRVEVDMSGRLTEELSGEPAIPGKDIVLTIDMNLQKIAMESLKRNIEEIRNRAKSSYDNKNFGDANAGAAVAIDVHTGEVLVMASYPGYDPAVFLEGASNKKAQEEIIRLFNDNNNPMLNRAIQGKYAPGSTFKPITAIAGLEEGVITPDTIIYDRGRTTIGGMDFVCLEYRSGLGAHGALNVKRALETSCNIYFHELGYRVGIDGIVKWADYFGLGRKTGIDLLDENKGTLASREYKKDAFKEEWWKADTAQAAIGQLYNEFTPIQLARYISAVANGGKLYKPYVIKKILDHEGNIVKETVPEYEQIPISESTIKAIKEGMIAVTQSIDGTAKEAFKDFPFEVAGKTGTAETGYESKQSSNALFVCYAPADDPEIAVAVVVEKGVWGSYTAPIARDIIEAYFGLNDTNKNDDSIKPGKALFIR